MPFCYSRRCCEILPSRFAVEFHTLVVLSKILQDSDLGEPLPNVIISTFVPLRKMLRDSDPDERSEIFLGVTALWWLA